MRSELAAWSAAERARASAEITRSLSVRLATERVGVVFAFAPMASEPDWLTAFIPSVRWAFPRIDGVFLRFFAVSDVTELVPGPRGAREPVGDDEVALTTADWILVPGVAFDIAGRRLGRGGGFYDRLLACPELRAKRVSVAFSHQIVERVPDEPHDARVDGLLTESGWIDCALHPTD